MNRLSAFSALPEVRSGVISDSAGTLMEHSGADDPEATAAVMGYLVNEIGQCGEALGFGPPEKISFTGKSLSCVLFVKNELVWTIYLDPTASQTAFEKKVDELTRATPKTPIGGLR